MAPISQREARRLMKRVTALESQIANQRKRWSQNYIGKEIARYRPSSPDSPMVTAIKTARTLDHAVVAIVEDGGDVRFVALPHPSESV